MGLFDLFKRGNRQSPGNSSRIDENDAAQTCSACGHAVCAGDRFCANCGSTISQHRGDRPQKRTVCFDSNDTSPEYHKSFSDIKCTRDDIHLFFHSAQGVGGDGEMVHLGMEGFYCKADWTVYITSWGPNRKSVEIIPVPSDVKKTKDEIIHYLQFEQHVYIPGMEHSNWA